MRIYNLKTNPYLVVDRIRATGQYDLLMVCPSWLPQTEAGLLVLGCLAAQACQPPMRYGQAVRLPSRRAKQSKVTRQLLDVAQAQVGSLTGDGVQQLIFAEGLASALCFS